MILNLVFLLQAYYQIETLYSIRSILQTWVTARIKSEREKLVYLQQVPGGKMG